MKKQEHSLKEEVHILDVKDVSLKLGDNLILRDINLQVKDVIRPNVVTGQIYSLIGPSGRGKTQLFKLLAGLNKPTTGTIKLFGKDVKAGDIGVVAQNYPLFKNRTILSNLEIAASFGKKLSKAEQKDKIEYYLTEFKLSDKAKSYPASLSGGQDQRIAIIQQLLCSEGFILMDEPFASLDVNMIDIALNTIVKIANLDELNTIIIISHDYVSAAAISEVMWFLGLDYDDKGNPIPGSTIKYEEDLMEKGIAWQYPEIFDEQDFMDFSKKVRKVFATL
jgi:ABC-type nitrate/sulfonate/bicarbonate transport system ATPase subunit